MKEPRMWWAGKDKGWMIDVEQPLLESEVKRCIKYTMDVQTQRYLGLIPGDRRDECAETIKALRDGRVSQNIIGKGDKVLYDAYKRENKKIFEMGNGS